MVTSFTGCICNFYFWFPPGEMSRRRLWFKRRTRWWILCLFCNMFDLGEKFCFLHEWGGGSHCPVLGLLDVDPQWRIRFSPLRVVFTVMYMAVNNDGHKFSACYFTYHRANTSTPASLFYATAQSFKQGRKLLSRARGREPYPMLYTVYCLSCYILLGDVVFKGLVVFQDHINGLNHCFRLRGKLVVCFFPIILEQIVYFFY